MQPRNENPSLAAQASNATVNPQPEVSSGWGACSKSGCNCKQFEGNAGTCANSGCGHAYSDHW